ncbi:hypothetical protein ACG9YX_06130 [Acinetobacter nematophilus]
MMLNIDQNKPINIFNFKKIISKLNLQIQVLPEHIYGNQVKGDLYQITHIEQKLKIELLQLLDEIGHNRISAAQQNLSHQHKVSGSFILIRQIPNHPQVIAFDGDGHYLMQVQPSKIAVVLENRQLFLNVDRVFNFLKSHTSVPCDQPIDFLFGTGNEISNSLHKQFLSTYEHLYLLFDCDLGGLKIAQNLYMLLPNHPMTFVQPNDIEQRLTKVIRLCKPDQLDKVGQLSLTCAAFIKPYASMIRRLNRTIEQESFLNDK